ncbi:MAG TPA: ShlB/FhaC/HecB family hemolysin secretion/activation protein [Opitutus sp.]|nr:ShlB/FhaC/HecB family hemolysin secretion/activation protein [Opitutus sp.]
MTISHMVSAAGTPRVLAGLLLLGGGTAGVRAQNLEELQPKPVPPQVAPPAPKPGAEPAKTLKVGLLKGEKVVLPALRGVAFYASAEAAAAGAPAAGLSVHGVPLLDTPDFRPIAQFFLDAPASKEGLDRLASATRLYLSAVGYPFSLVYLPPQDITAGIVRYVVVVSRLQGEVEVQGAKYFSVDQYRDAVRLVPGQPLGKAALQADVDWINRNPFRAATAAAVAGSAPGTTKILLQVNEKFPLRFFSGIDNTGTRTTKLERFNAGINWGNAFGLGHILTAQWNSSWDFRTLRSGSGSYVINLPWRHVLSFSGAYSLSNAALAAPFQLKGRSWQVSADYQIPLAPRPNLTHALDFAVDFKSSDNNFAFADIPISNNLTEVVQARAMYSGNVVSKWGLSGFGVTLTAAPGGLTDRNHDRYFRLSRAGAKADYVYLRGNASHRFGLDRIRRGLAWSVRGQFQLSNHNLIGSEQFQGGGMNSVRGYEEGEVYTDNGVLLSHELHLPAFSPGLGRGRVADRLDVYLFEDYAHLWSTDRLPGETDTDLHSAGAGLGYVLGPHVTVRAAYGWEFIDSGSSQSGDNSRLHFAAQVSF